MQAVPAPICARYSNFCAATVSLVTTAGIGLHMEVSSLSHPSSIPGLRGPSALLRLQSDERLIALTRRGQHAAFEVLCARYQSRLLAFCRHMLASREDAEDVLQEVFAAAFNAVLADERDINVRPWLYRIARNRSLNHLRRTSAIGVDSMDVHYADGGISTGEKVMRRESFRELIADVHELPETQRTALLLREIDALSYEQIAHAMETTIPSVKSLLVRARISLAEAAEARNLSCDDVRLELGTAAEGLGKLSTPARRHVRGCERCTFFKKQLKNNNHALAMIMPVGPLLLLKKLVLAKLGSTASASAGHVAGGASATVGATVGVGAAASGGGSVAGGLVTAGAGAIATKAVAGLAAAAIVTAGAVAADNAGVVHRHHHPHAALSASATDQHFSEPIVVRQAQQPVSAGNSAANASSVAHPPRHAKALKLAKSAPPKPVPTAPTTPAASSVTAATPTKPADQQPTVQVTEVTTNTTTLPTTATTTPSTTTATPPTTTTTSVPPPAPVTTTTTVEATPPPAAETPPAAPETQSTQPSTPSVQVSTTVGGTEAPGEVTSVATE
jgi:RNA polymerase sigma factor (sigma-70 family)